MKNISTILAYTILAFVANALSPVSALAVLNPVVTKTQAAFVTNVGAGGYCGLARRNSSTHACSYPTLAQTKATCDTTIIHFNWIVRCDMRYTIHEARSAFSDVYGCRYLVDKARPLWKIQGYCADGPPRFIKSVRVR
jgi:hypothetical protein